jgi:hypothetical protein
MDELEIRVYDKTGGWIGNVGAPESVKGSVLQHGPGSFQLTLRENEPYLDAIMTPGARIAMDLRGAPLFSGMRRPIGNGLVVGGSPTCTIQGDRRLLDNHLALVVPGGPLAPTSTSGAGRLGQAVVTDAAGPDGTVVGQGGYMQWPAELSTAESLVKWLLTQNLVRSREPVVIAPDQGRGGDARAAGVLPQVRMDKLSEAIQPLLDWSGLTLTALRNRSGLVVVEVRESFAWPAAFTVESGVVVDGSWTITPPSATRVILGGPGEDAARAFWQVNDATGLEDEYGDSIEVFKDATGATLTWPQSLDQSLQVAKYYLLRTDVTEANKTLFRAYLDEAARGALVDGLPVTSIAAELAETDQFHFGGQQGVLLGDELTVTAASGVDFHDVATEAEVTYTASEGLAVKTKLGDLSDSPDRKQARLIARLFAAQRRMARNR